MSEAADNLATNMDEFKSIWCASREVASVVDQKKLKKAEAKIAQKQGIREGSVEPNPIDRVPILQEATASQMISKRDAKLDDAGNSRSKDIKIENFDIAFADKVLLRGADLTLVSEMIHKSLSFLMSCFIGLWSSLWASGKKWNRQIYPPKAIVKPWLAYTEAHISFTR